MMSLAKMETKTRGTTIAKPYSQAFGASFQKKTSRANIGKKIKAKVWAII